MERSQKGEVLSLSLSPSLYIHTIVYICRRIQTHAGISNTYKYIKSTCTNTCTHTHTHTLNYTHKHISMRLAHTQKKSTH